MPLIRYQDSVSSPWKNGGGSTKQLLISPANANLSDFDYRISIASISSDGAFSPFIGIDRQLLILEGDGVTLSMDSERAIIEREMKENGGIRLDNTAKGQHKLQAERVQQELTLTPEDNAFCFHGETAIESRLLGSHVIDFNVMTKRGSYQAHTEKLSFDGAFIEEAPAITNDVFPHNNKIEQRFGIRLLCCLDTMTWEHDGQIINIAPYDLLICRQDERITLRTTKPSQLIRVTLSAVNS